VIAGNPTAVTVNVIVYELTGTLNAQDYFTGRSQDRYGLAEKVDLGFIATPNVSANQMGGLSWLVSLGNGTISQNTNGNFVYTAPNSPNTENIRIEVASGPSKGNGITYLKQVIAPNGAIGRQTPNTGVGHNQGLCDVGFSLEPFLFPTDVSFRQLSFAEGTVLPTTANGYYSDQANYWHPRMGPASIISCDIVLGCKADFQDGPQQRDGVPPCTNGTFIWDIPWEYVLGTRQRIPFTTVRHHVFNIPNDKVTIEKAGVGPFTKAVSDPNSPIFP
jgi:hypothetical protein